MSPLPEGIIGALVTPLRDDGAPDWAMFAELIELHIAGGVQGVLVLGTVGEGILFTEGDRKRILLFVRKQVDGRIPVVAHCGAPDTATVVDLASHAERIGVEAIAVVGPFFYRYEEEALAHHFIAASRAAPDTDMYLYNNPDRVGYSLSPDLVVRLVQEIPTISGLKETGDSVGRMVSYLARAGKQLDLYVGSNTLVLPALAVGARGAVSALANVTPELMVALHQAWVRGRLDEARALQQVVGRLDSFLSRMPYIAAIKHLATMRGLKAAGSVRAPLPDLNRDQAAALEDWVTSEKELIPWIANGGKGQSQFGGKRQ